MNDSPRQALFVPDGDRYQPTPWSRGPWGPDLLHGGATAALLTHGIEMERSEPDLVAGRLTVDLLRPVRTVPLQLSTQVVRTGRRIKLVDAFLHDDHQLVARASAMLLRRDVDSPFAHGPRTSLPSWEGLAPRQMGQQRDYERLYVGTEFRPAPRNDPTDPCVMWMRAPFDLCPNQPMTPLEYTSMLADYVNAVSTMAEPRQTPFINSDITLNLFREPVGEWLAMVTGGRLFQAGISASLVDLHDAIGPLGSVSCCCLANNPPPTN